MVTVAAAGLLTPRVATAAPVKLTRGTLTAPSMQPAKSIAQRFVASHPQLLRGADPATVMFEREVPVKRGTLVRFSQTYRGLPVIGGETMVRLDSSGRVRWASSAAARIPASMSLQPTLAPRAVLAKVAAVTGYATDVVNRVDAQRATRLVVYAHSGMATPRLAYWVELPLDLRRLVTPRAFVDAETGQVYRLENLSKRHGPPTCPGDYHEAYVYETNPVETPELTCVSLAPWLAPGATSLANTDVVATNCLDTNSCEQITGDFPVIGNTTITAHMCERVPAATTNGAGDFTDYTFISNTESEDEFAEVQMFYHVNKVYEVARALGGFTDLVNKPLTAVTNFRIPPFDQAGLSEILLQNGNCTNNGDGTFTYNGSFALQPLDNAAFAAAGTLIPGIPPEDSIMFGQGTSADFAYDGDVIYHEFGHAVMATVAPMLSGGFIDQYGLNPTPGGLHEGFADLMTMFVTNDPEIGEYAGASLTGGSAIRNIDNATTCPTDLIGESHYDSLPFTGAVWQARSTVATTPADRTSFDEAVFAAQQALGAADGFAGAAAKIVAEIEIAMGASVATQVETIFAQRGIDGCNNRVVDAADGKAQLYLTGTDALQGAAEVPAPIQFRYDLSEHASAISIDISTVQAGGLGGIAGMGGDPSMKLVLKVGDEPILWSQGPGGISGDYTQSVDVSFAGTTVQAGDASLAGDFPPGVYHLMLVNTGPTMVLGNITLAHTAGMPAGDASPDSDANSLDGGNNADGDGGGCCQASTDPANTAGGLLLVLLVGAVHRRRRALSMGN